MEKIYLLGNYKAWGELPEDDYDRTSFESHKKAIIKRDVADNGLARLVNDETEMNILIHFLGLENFEEIMSWVGSNSISVKEMLAILQLDVIERSDVEEIIFINDFPKYAQKKYLEAKKDWLKAFEDNISRIMKQEGFNNSFVKYITDGAFEKVDANFWKVVEEMYALYVKENNKYYSRDERTISFYGVLRLADEYMSTEKKNRLVGDKFEKFIEWAAMAAANEVEDEFIYENKGTYNEKRHFYNVTLRNFSFDKNNIFVV